LVIVNAVLGDNGTSFVLVVEDQAVASIASYQSHGVSVSYDHGDRGDRDDCGGARDGKDLDAVGGDDADDGVAGAEIGAGCGDDGRSFRRRCSVP
jgi:hypothetical protein